MRWVYVSAGLLALSASCYMAVLASGGIQSLSAPALIAMAVILGVGAASVGTAIAGGHTGIAIVIILGMLAGEAGAMIQTAQRVTAAREASRAPRVALELKRKTALAELADAKAAKPAPVDHSRLEAAEKAKAEAETAVRGKSAEADCRQNCRLLLQSSVDGARREVDTARAEFARHETDQFTAIAERIKTAEADVATLPPPQSATPLADYTGVPEWLFDMIEALTLSFSINLPASALIALGVKMGRAPRSEEASKEPAKAIIIAEGASPAGQDSRPRLSPPKAKKDRDPAVEAERFGLAVLRPADDGRLSPGDLRSAYVDWCQRSGKEPLAIEAIAPALGKLFRNAGITFENGIAVGVAIRSA